MNVQTIDMHSQIAPRLPTRAALVGAMGHQSGGFSLLELSIVLVIIGLLIGGVFVGQSLIKNAQMNAVIQEYGRYQAAAQAFKEQYGGLPGDLKNATQIWGVAGGTGGDAACFATVSLTPATCNGNGDGQISNIVSASPASGDELLRFWQHLANAKMVEGSFTGSSVVDNFKVGVTIPESRYGGGQGWYPERSSDFPSVGDTNWFAADYGVGNNLLFTGSGLPPKDAWSIDKKIDDGKPATGSIIGWSWGPCTTAASNTDVGATYKLSSAGKLCNLLFLTNF